MRRAAYITRVAIFLGGACSVFAQAPFLYSRAAYNAASFMPAGVPSGAIARGAIFSVFGTHLGPATPVTANTYPLGTTLGGISMNVVQGSTVVAVIPIYVSPNQINAIMPSNAPVGTASLQVVNGAKSNMTPIRVAANAFGIFTALGTGAGPGILQNYITAANQPVNAPVVPAQPGQVITLWGTGLGAVPSDTVAPTAGNLPTKTEVFVGGVSAPVAYSGRTPCCAGTDQIVFTVPQNAPQGCWVPVYVRLGGATVSNVVTMAIASPGSQCTTDIFPRFTAAALNGTVAGVAGVTRVVTHEDLGVTAPVDVSADYATYFAYSDTTYGQRFPFHPVLSFVPSGTCTAYTLAGDMLAGDPLPGLIPNTTLLDFGPPLSLTGPKGTRSLAFNQQSPWPISFLGGAISNNILNSTLFLDPGAYTVQSSGGAGIGGFSANFTLPPPPTWTGRDQLLAVDRTKPLNISWTGGDAGQIVFIVGISEDLPSNSSAGFGCIAPAGATTFTVPTDMLANLPASRANPLRSKQVIYLLNVPGASMQKINASGIGDGLTGAFQINGKTVAFQ
ncbi:MAG TPA: hypothetical protein VGN17_11005 [Bryobacteraceae bacterium]|jgi:uncharacterized protein (TIGR03437 family)